MKISELSRQAGVPLATVKFYLREGLLQPGERLSANQADYGPDHLVRLRLIRTLREVGGLGLGPIKHIVAALDGGGDTPAVIAAVDAIAGHPGPVLSESVTAGPLRPQAESDVAALIESLGWTVRPESPVRSRLVDALVALRSTIEPGLPREAFQRYAEMARTLAEYESGEGISDLSPGVAGQVEEVVAGTILWEMVFTTLRRLAHESLAIERALGLQPASRLRSMR